MKLGKAVMILRRLCFHEGLVSMDVQRALVGRIGGSGVLGELSGLLTNSTSVGNRPNLEPPPPSHQQQPQLQQSLQQQSLQQHDHSSAAYMSSSDAAESKCDDNDNKTLQTASGLGSGLGPGSGLGSVESTNMDVEVTDGDNSSSSAHQVTQQSQQHQLPQPPAPGLAPAPGQGLSIRFARGGLSPRLLTPPAFDMNVTQSSLLLSLPSNGGGEGGGSDGGGGISSGGSSDISQPSLRDNSMMDVEINEASPAQGPGLGPGLYSTGSCKLQAIQGLLARSDAPYIIYIPAYNKIPSYMYLLIYNIYPFIYTPIQAIQGLLARSDAPHIIYTLSDIIDPLSDII